MFVHNYYGNWNFYEYNFRVSVGRDIKKCEIYNNCNVRAYKLLC